MNGYDATRDVLILPTGNHYVVLQPEGKLAHTLTTDSWEECTEILSNEYHRSGGRSFAWILPEGETTLQRLVYTPDGWETV